MLDSTIDGKDGTEPKGEQMEDDGIVDQAVYTLRFFKCRVYFYYK